MSIGPVMRRAVLADHPSLVTLERVCFPPARQDGPASIRRSLSSARQSVWIIPFRSGAGGSAVFFHHPRMLRIYSVAVHPDCRGRGWGVRLLDKAQEIAKRDGADRICLETDRSDRALVSWYERRGFRITKILSDYYGRGKDAVRMETRL